VRADRPVTEVFAAAGEPNGRLRVHLPQ